MIDTRIIPVLLLQNKGLVKTVKFKNPTYIGDPINAVKIFNEKEVDELVFLDILAYRHGGPRFDVIASITNECFMPLCYGGGIENIDHIKKIFSLGVEKAAINSYAQKDTELVKKAAQIFGSQSIIVSIDVKRNVFQKMEVVTCGGTKKTGLEPVQYAVMMEEMGAGELMVNSVDRDGTMKGYDIELVEKIAKAVNIPVIACGGAGKLADFGAAAKAGASAAAAGSMFVFYGPNRAVLINYPTRQEIKEALNYH